MMKKYLSMMTIALMGIVMYSCDNEDDDPQSEFKLLADIAVSDSCYLSNDTTNFLGYYYRDDISMPPFELIHTFSKAYGLGYGFTYCNLKNDSTPGYQNLSAITANGHRSDTYFIASTGGNNFGIPAEISFTGGKSYKAKSIYVTNSTYAYMAIKNQNDGLGKVKQWTDKDWFKLTIMGIGVANDTTGIVSFLLADGMDVVNDWQYVDLTRLGNVSKLCFSLSSTDNGQWGMNTPAYFAFDELTISE
jgi:hypothetical protein